MTTNTNDPIVSEANFNSTLIENEKNNTCSTERPASISIYIDRERGWNPHKILSEHTLTATHTWFD